MKNKVLGLSTAIYRVQDLKAAKEWYQAFGTELSLTNPNYVGFNMGMNLDLNSKKNIQQTKWKTWSHFGELMILTQRSTDLSHWRQQKTKKLKTLEKAL